MSEDVPQYGEAINFTSESSFRVRGNRVFVVPLDRERDEAGISQLAQSEVIIDGSRYRCIGVERFMHMPPWSKGESVGLMVEPLPA